MASWRPKQHYHFNLIAITLIAAALCFYAIFRIFFSHAASNNADFNADGTVNITDLSILATHWNQTGLTQAQGDANGDGSANITDLSILATQWGTNPGGGGTTAGCTAANDGIAGFPCTTYQGGSAGFPIHDALTTMAFNTNGSCANCPAGVSAKFETSTDQTEDISISQCITLDHWKIKAAHGVSIFASNGFSDEAHPCVTITNSYIAVAVATGANAGPLIIRNSEIDGMGAPCPTGQSYHNGTTSWTVSTSFVNNTGNCGEQVMAGPRIYADSIYIHGLWGWGLQWTGPYDVIRNSVVRDFQCNRTPASPNGENRNLCLDQSPNPIPPNDLSGPAPENCGLSSCDTGSVDTGCRPQLSSGYDLCAPHQAAVESNRGNPIADVTFENSVWSCNAITADRPVHYAGWPSQGAGCTGSFGILHGIGSNGCCADQTRFYIDHNLMTDFGTCQGSPLPGQTNWDPTCNGTSVANSDVTYCSNSIILGTDVRGVGSYFTVTNNVWDLHGASCGCPELTKATGQSCAGGWQGSGIESDAFNPSLFNCWKNNTFSDGALVDPTAEAASPPCPAYSSPALLK